MLKQRARLISTGLRLVDLAVLALAFPCAYLLRDRVLGLANGGLYPISTYWPLLAASLLGWQAASRLSGLYGAYRTQSIMTELLRVGRSLVLLALLIAAGHFLWRGEHEVSRLFFGLYFGIAYTLLAANRVVIRLTARASRRRGRNTKAFAVVGTGEMAQEAVTALRAHPEWGYRFAGYVTEEGCTPPPGAPVLGRLAELGTLLETHVLDDVIFAVGREQLEGVEAAVLLCEEQGVNVRVVLNFFPNRISRLAVEDLEGLPMLAFTSTPSGAGPLAGKRVFDVVVSALALLLLSPLFALLALAIKLDSAGPVLFRQRRLGLYGRPFSLYKFRSMHADAEARLHHLRGRNEMSGPVFKMRDDPRVTRVGRLLRKTSLDEAPQFLNVLRGEMSVVGPRPPLPSEVRLYERWQRRRLSVKPGLTCEWQVRGRSEVDFAEWMKLDLHYIDHWSLWHDLKIVLRTIPAVVLGKGAR